MFDPPAHPGGTALIHSPKPHDENLELELNCFRYGRRPERVYWRRARNSREALSRSRTIAERAFAGSAASRAGRAHLSPGAHAKRLGRFAGAEIRKPNRARLRRRARRCATWLGGDQ